MSVAAVFERVPTSSAALWRENDEPLESFRWDEADSMIVRTVRTRSGSAVESRIHSMQPPKPRNLAAAFDAAWLRASERPKLPGPVDVRFADLFAGCGAMSIGVIEACRALGKVAHPMFAADMNRKALDVYSENFAPRRKAYGPIEQELDSPIGSALSSNERALKKGVGEIDLVVGGPPCQGNSDLNNHTRRHDPKNALYLRMVRFAEVFEPQSIIIENVRGVLHDANNVVGAAQEALERLKYTVEVLVIPGEDLGVPQRRRRVFLLASKEKLFPLEEELARYRQPSRSFAWACGDLIKTNANPLLDATGIPSATNKRRIDYLFDNDCYDLPNSERPSCHRDKEHSYNSVYGRMRWDAPAPTITTGFGSMGQGRYVHPKQRRTITPHEAARLQFIPDFFVFGDCNRAAVAEMIGNAVPPKMAYVAALHLLR